MDAITAEATTRADAITAEALARTTADGLSKKHSHYNNTDAISAETLARTTADGLKTQLFLIMDAITAETLKHQQSRWSQNTAISNNTCNNSRSFS
jgi:hypothetical protein